MNRDITLAQLIQECGDWSQIIFKKRINKNDLENKTNLPALGGSDFSHGKVSRNTENILGRRQ